MRDNNTYYSYYSRLLEQSNPDNLLREYLRVLKELENAPFSLIKDVTESFFGVHSTKHNLILICNDKDDDTNEEDSAEIAEDVADSLREEGYIVTEYYLTDDWEDLCDDISPLAQEMHLHVKDVRGRIVFINFPLAEITEFHKRSSYRYSNFIGVIPNAEESHHITWISKLVESDE